MTLKDTLAKAEVILDELGSPRDFLDRLGMAIGQTYKKLRIDQVNIEGGSINSVDVDKVLLGTATIDRIQINGLSANLKNGEAALKNVRTIIELGFVLEWKIDLGFVGSWSGSDDLGSMDIPFVVGDVSIPALNDIQMFIPTVEVPGISALMSPIDNLHLGKTQMTGVALSSTELPGQGFAINGLGFGSMNVTNVGIPSSNSKRATIQDVTPENHIVLPQASLRELEIPQTKVQDIFSPGFGTTAVASERKLSVDLGILALTLKVIPTVHLNVESMAITDVELYAMANDLNLQNISLPVSVRGIKIDNIDLKEINVNQISV